MKKKAITIGKKTIIMLLLPLAILTMAFTGTVYQIGDRVSIGSYSNSLNTAISSLGAQHRTIDINTTVTLTANATLPANLALEIGENGLIQLGNYNLTILGDFDCPPNNQAFSYTGTGRVSFQGACVTKVYPAWWGAKGDGTTDDTAAFNYALDAMNTEGSCLFVPKGYYRANIVLTVGTLYSKDLVGEETDSTILRTYTPGGYALTLKGSVEAWKPHTIKNLSIVGDSISLADGGIQFGVAGSYVAGDEYIGRVVFDKLFFDNLNIAIRKPSGNIGNTFRNCAFDVCNYHYYADNPTGHTMHCGCDWFYDCHFEAAKLASIYISSPYETGQTVFTNCIHESNPGFAFFIENYHGYTSPGLIINNDHFESNATAGSVTINSIAYTPRELRFKDTNVATITNSKLNSIELVNSVVFGNNVGPNIGSFDVIKDNDSLLLLDNVRVDYLKFSENYFIQNIINSTRPIGGYSTCLNTVPRSIITNGYNGTLCLSESFADEDTYNFSNPSTETTVRDGVIFPRCVEVEFPAGVTSTSPMAATIPHGKYIVWSLDIKTLTTPDNNLTVQLVGDRPLSCSLKLQTANKWYSFVGLGHPENPDPGTDFTVRIYVFNNTAAAHTIRFSALQILAFDKLQDAIEFIRKGVFVYPTDMPKTLIGDKAPTAGTWIVGDTVLNKVSSAGAPRGWVCTGAGTPGTWVNFGQIGYRTNAGSPSGSIAPTFIGEDGISKCLC
ncbi:MAG: glycosyl hydrolase family 28-related protein [bacterium]